VSELTRTDGDSMEVTARPVLDVGNALDGARLIVVGGTGFLGKVWVAQTLHCYPNIGKLFLVVRAKKGMDADTRLWREIVTAGPFDALRAELPGTAFEEFIREKIEAVDADVGRFNCGLSDEWIAARAGTVDALVNVAGVVDFNPPLDEAVLANARGVAHLVELAKAIGNIPVLHTSTAYVAGYRRGKIREIDPKDFPFPKCDEIDPSRWSPMREIDECLALVEDVKRRAKEAHKQTELDAKARENLERKGEPSTGPVYDEERAKVERRWLEDQLAIIGQERAKYWGFSNVYTYTKSLGEQVLANSGLPYTLVRPTVIESTVRYPFPGWNEGINTMAPLIYLCMKGHIQVPSSEETTLDVIPADMVTSAMTAALGALVSGRAKPVYHVGSSDTQPLPMTRLIELVGLYKRKHYQRTGKGNPFLNYVLARIEPQAVSVTEFYSHGAPAIANASKGLAGLLNKAAVGPIASLAKGAAKALSGYSEIAKKNGEIWEMFVPFTAETAYEFRCDETRALFAELSERDREHLNYAPETLDWRVYLHDVQIPGLEKWCFGQIDEKLERKTKALRAYTSLRHMLEERVQRTPHAKAIARFERDGVAEMTYAELGASVESAAARLHALGVRKGDRVAIAAKNHPMWVVAYFGVIRVGAVVVPMDAGLEAEPFTNVLAASKARVLVWDGECAAQRESAVRDRCRDVVLADLHLLSEREDALVAPEVPSPAADELASVIFTSGTTGTPRGVMLTHGNFCSLVAALSPVFPLTERDRAVSVLPLHHTFEFTCGLLLPISRGASIVYLDELTGERLGEAMKTVRVTAMVGVPALWQLLERRILSKVAERGPFAKSAFDFMLEVNRVLGTSIGADAGKALFGAVHDELGGSVRFLISGGAALPKDTAKLFQGLGLHLSEGYGLTEAAPVLTVQKGGPGKPVGVVGVAVPNVEVKISAPDASGVGEVLARGPNVMVGYSDDADATSKALDEQGWLHTGDLGRIDRKGRLELVGRSKDVVVTASGENVYPDDVERAVGDVSDVVEWCLCGVSDPKGGERLACVAVAKRENEPKTNGNGNGNGNGANGTHEIKVSSRGESEPELSASERHERARKALERAFAKLPMNQQPALLFIVDAELPKTATRKVQRNKVKALAERLAEAQRAAKQGASSNGSAKGSTAHTASVVRAAIASIARRDVSTITATTRLRDELGFDSLMALELATTLESVLGVANVGEELSKLDTVAALEEALGVSAQESSMARSRTSAIEAAEEEDEKPELPGALRDLGRAAAAVAQREFYGRVLDVTVSGKAFIPHNRSTLVVANHSSHLDMGLVKYALGTYGRDLVALAAKDYFFEGNRVRTMFVENFTNLVPLDRNAGMRQTLRAVGSLIEEGKTVLIFPEGTRSTDGTLRPFKGAVGYLALQHRVDILPVYVGGTFEALPKGAKWLRKRKVSAKIGLPLEIEHLERLCEGLGPVDRARRVAQITQKAVEELKAGRTLDLRTLASWEDEDEANKVHPLVSLFDELGRKFKPGAVSDPVSFYFTLGNEPEAKWTVRVNARECTLKQGKPDGGSADCVLKTTADIFTRIVRENYTPGPSEFMAGLIKSNDVALLETFQKAFGLG